MSSLPDKKSTFPVGPAGRRELRRALARSTDPGETIQSFQRSHSLHSMLARAFDTVPRHAAAPGDQVVVEPLDTDSVLTFLSHLGVSQHEVNRRVADSLLIQVEDEIRKAQGTEPLLQLLRSFWPYSTSIPELRPVLWAVLKQLGPQTPLPVLELLGERDGKTGELKHADVWHPLPPLLKRLVWEADWDKRVGLKEKEDPGEYYDLLQSTLFGAKIQPSVDMYCNSTVLVEAANRPFVGSLRERRVATSQRRTISKTTTDAETTELSKPVSQLRRLLAGGETPAYRPKLLHAVVSLLMAKHGKIRDHSLLGGASHLHCTLLADILLSGPLPKAYQHVLSLARTLDESVKGGVITDSHVARIQATLRHIYPSDGTAAEVSTPSKESNSKSVDSQDYVKGILEKIIKSALDALKEADPQALFLNPVTDAIAPGYSKVISKPMCIKEMELKLGEYKSLGEWEKDVQLMYRNCIDYNVGNAGQWFRGEARRQGKIFRDDILSQAKRHFQTAMAKRGDAVTADGRAKRKLEASSSEPGVEVSPLPASQSKKRKKDNQLPSMPAIASMLLSDPFVVRLLLDRALRSVRIDTSRGGSIPASHRIVPSLLQLMNIANWSTRICAIRGKRFFVPDVGFVQPQESEDAAATAPFSSLRVYTPLLTKLFLEAELDRRLAIGGDLNAAARSLPKRTNVLKAESWGHNSEFPVILAMVEGALVHVSQVGNSHEGSLSVTFPKFCVALEQLTETNLWNERPFFLSLIQALLRHKSKLPRNVRDVIVSTWLKWLRTNKGDNQKYGSMTSAAHECFILLLNEWANLGNLLLPRDLLIQLSQDAIDASDASESSADRKFAHLWESSDVADFQAVKDQYNRMIQHLTTAQADQWKEDLKKRAASKTDTSAETEPGASTVSKNDIEGNKDAVGKIEG